MLKRNMYEGNLFQFIITSFNYETNAENGALDALLYVDQHQAPVCVGPAG